ncbi:hypothetical protein OTU49_008541 [Cherax quadricarinatus]|uniref:Innexin n=1 Tax=Cherax quadricarinatus TaxID=27406 RepID=A0AAW0WQD7_CHEQU
MAQWIKKFLEPRLVVRIVKWITTFGTGELTSISTIFHRLALLLLVILFARLQLSGGEIKCFNRNGGQVIPPEYIDMCVTKHYSVGYNDGDGSRTRSKALKYIFWLSYLFIPYSTLVFAEYILSDNRLQKPLPDASVQYDLEGGGATARNIAVETLGQYVGSFSRLLHSSIVINLMMLILDMFSLLSYYWLTNGKILEIFTKNHVSRDAVTYADCMSLVFPSFARCDIEVEDYIHGDSSTHYGCYIPQATVYQEIVTISVLLFTVLAVVTLLQLVYLCIVCCVPCVARSLMTCGGAVAKIYEERVMRVVSTGDLLALSYIRRQVTAREYNNIIIHVATRRVEEE